MGLEPLKMKATIRSFETSPVTQRHKVTSHKTGVLICTSRLSASRTAVAFMLDMQEVFNQPYISIYPRHRELLDLPFDWYSVSRVDERVVALCFTVCSSWRLCDVALRIEWSSIWYPICVCVCVCVWLWKWNELFDLSHWLLKSVSHYYNED